MGTCGDSRPKSLSRSEALKVLERMAGGEPRYPETQDAIESLERVKAKVK